MNPQEVHETWRPASGLLPLHPNLCGLLSLPAAPDPYFSSQGNPFPTVRARPWQPQQAPLSTGFRGIGEGARTPHGLVSKAGTLAKPWAPSLAHWFFVFCIFFCLKKKNFNITLVTKNGLPYVTVGIRTYVCLTSQWVCAGQGGHALQRPSRAEGREGTGAVGTTGRARRWLLGPAPWWEGGGGEVAEGARGGRPPGPQAQAAVGVGWDGDPEPWGSRGHVDGGVGGGGHAASPHPTLEFCRSREASPSGPRCHPSMTCTAGS